MAGILSLPPKLKCKGKDDFGLVDLKKLRRQALSVQWKCQLNINYSGSAGPRKSAMQMRYFWLHGIKCGFHTETREPLVVFRSSWCSEVFLVFSFAHFICS